jgi:hypothetical protein
MIRLITGPPGAGKNTYIEKNKKPEDVVFDFDILRSMTGSVERAKVMREAFEADLQNYENDVWVIRCVADAKARTELAERLKAEQVVVIETPADVAKKQVTDRGREPERNDEVFAAIDDWWSQYGVVESDLIVRPDTGPNLSDRKKNMPDLEQKSGTETDKGFPAETKIVDMTPEEQAAYWKFQSRKHEGRANTLAAEAEAKNKPEVKPEVKPEANAPIDAAELRKQILAEIKLEQAPDLVRNQFKSLIGDRLPETSRDAILEDLNTAKYVKEDGSIDTDAIKARAEVIAPASEKRVRKVRPHQGDRRQESITSVQSGRELFEAEANKNKRG